MKDRTSILHCFVKSQENTKQKDLVRYEPVICPYCISGCGMYLVVKEDRVVGVEPKKDYPLNEGETCIKGGSAYKFFDHPDRLWTPLVHGKACSWEEAFSPVAEKFSSVGPEEFGALGSGKTSNEESYLLQKFTRAVMHSNNVEYCARFCHSATVAGLGPTVGSEVMQASQLDLDRADCILLAGVNLSENFPGIARRIRRAREKGAKAGCILYDEGITQHVTGSDNIKLLADLALLTGHIGSPGTGVNPLRGQISAPDLGNVKKAFENMDFLVVQDIFMTETAELADLACGKWGLERGERDGTVIEVCSVDIPLSKLAHNLSKVASSLFRYHPGEDRDAPLPYSDIPEDERRSQSPDLQHPEAVGRTNSS